MKVINQSIPEKAGLYINSFYEPTGAYELWLETTEGLFKSGWIKCSEEPSEEFLQSWLIKMGVGSEQI